MPIPKKPVAKPKVTKTEQQKNKSEVKTNKEKDKYLEELIAEINKKHGENAVYHGIPADVTEIKYIPTGSVSLDIALGGGIPMGRYTEISGGFSSTKTSQVLLIIAEAQKMGLTCAFIDVEGTTDDKYAEQLGVDFNSIIYSNPDSAEEATQIILDLQNSGKVNFIALDSLASMSPNDEIAKNTSDNAKMAASANVNNRFFRKYNGINNRLRREKKEPLTLVCINQLRERPGMNYGDPEYTPGGRGKGFYSTVEIRLRRGDWLTEGKGENKAIVGQVVKYKIEKNKTGIRMKTGEFDFYFDENTAGIDPGHNDNFKEVIIEAVEWDVIVRAGSWFSYKKQRWQGLDAIINALRDDPNLSEELKEQVLALSNKKCD